MRLTLILCLLLSFPCSAATVYKSIDARGRISYSDSPPVAAVSVETLVLHVRSPEVSDEYRSRLAEMTEVTNRMAADRLQREQARMESRQRLASTSATSEFVISEEYYPVYSSTRQQHYRRGYYPRPPVVYPHLVPVRGQPLVNQYPASVVRRSYGPHVASVFQNQPVPHYPAHYR